MANDNQIDLKITATSETKKAENELKQLGETGEKSVQKITQAEKEELGLLGKLEKQLKDLKEARSKANSEEDIEKLNKEILEAEKNLKRLNSLGDGSETEKAIKGLSKETENFGSQLGNLPGPAGEVAGSIQSIGAAANPATILVAALAAAIVGTFIASKESAFALAEETKEIKRLKDITGVATLTAVIFNQAIKTTGGSAEDVADVFNQLAQVVSEVKAGNKDLAASFERLGITDLSNLDVVVKQVGKSLSTLPKDIQTVSDFSKLLGEEGVRQFSSFAGEIDNVTKKVDEYGLANEETLRRGLELNKAVNESALAFQALTTSIGRETAPAFTEITKDISAFIVELSKSEQAKKFFRDFSEGLLEVVKFTVLTKNALQDLLNIVDPLVKEFTRFDSVLELLANGSLPGSIIQLTKVANTYLLGDRALADQIKRQQEYEQKLKETAATASVVSRSQLEAIEAVKNGITQLIDANDKLLQQEKLVADERIQNIERLVVQGTTTEKDAAIEVGRIKQELADKEVELARENFNKISELKAQGNAVSEELANAEIALRQSVLVAEKERIEATKEAQKAAFDEEKERIEGAKQDRQVDITEELAEIKELENNKTILHAEAAKKRREITLKELQTQIDEETSLSNNADIGEKPREEARKRLSDLIRKQAEIDRQTEKDIQQGIVKDTEDANKAKIASNKTVSDAAKSEAEKQKALADLQKTVEKVAFDEKISQLKASGATAEQIAIETANFEIEQQQKIIEAIRIKIEVQKAANTGNKELSAELIKLDADLIAAQGKLNQLTADRNGILEKTKNIIGQIKAEGASSNDAFTKSVEASAKSVEKLGDRVGSAVDAIGRGGVRIGESFDIASQSAEELKIRIEELTNSANFIEAFFAGPGKQEAVIEIRNTVAKLNTDLINRVQGEALRAAQAQAAEELRIQQEKNSQLIEINQERLDDLADLEEDFEEKKRKLAEDTQKENQDFADREFERTKKLNEDKLKAAQDFAEKENEIAEQSAEREAERQRDLAELKENIALDSADKLNKILRDSLVEQANLEAQINAEKDPKKKAELQAKLAEVQAKAREKESKEKEKQAELDKLLGENLSEEELKAKQEAIEKKFQLDQDAQEQREALIKAGNTKALEEFDRLVAEQKKRDEDRLAAELQRIKDAAKRKEAQEAAERQKRLDDYNQRLTDLQGAFDKEREEAQKAHDKRLDDLKKQQGEIKAEYKKTYDDINQRAIDSAKQIGATGQAIADAFALGNKEVEKYLANLEKVGKAQAGVNPGGTTTSSPSSSTPPNSGIGNNSSPVVPSSSNPFGSPSNNNNNAGPPTSPPPSPTGKQTTTTGSQQGGKQPGISKDKAGSQPSAGSVSVPGQIKTAAEYSKIAFDIYDKFDKIVGDQNPFKLVGEKASRVTELLNKLSNVNFTYTRDAGLTAEETKAIAPNMPYLLNSKNAKENRKIFGDQLANTIKYVETNRKVKGKDKGAGVGGDIATKDTPIIDTSGSSGSTKGDVKDTGNQSGSQAPPPAPPKDTRFDPKRENESEGFNEFEDKIISPDAAIPKAPGGTPTTPAGQQAPSVANNPVFAPQINSNPTFIIQTQDSAESVQKKLTDLNSALQDETNQAAQAILRTMDQRTLNLIKNVLR